MTPDPLLSRLSRRLARVEIAFGAALVLAILCLLTANAAARALAVPLVWTDELAVHLMVCLAFTGASVAVARREHMAMGLLPEALSPRARRALVLAVDLLMLGFLILMAGLVWRWLDPVGLLRAGSGAALAQETFNFVYTDPTQTLGIRKIWFWAILPVSTLTALVHSAAMVAESLSLLRRPAEGTA